MFESLNCSHLHVNYFAVSILQARLHRIASTQKITATLHYSVQCAINLTVDALTDMKRFSLAVSRSVRQWKSVTSTRRIWIFWDTNSSTVQWLIRPCDSAHHQWLLAVLRQRDGVPISVKLVGRVAADVDCLLSSAVCHTRLQQLCSVSNIRQAVDLRRRLWATSHGRHKCIVLETLALVTQTKLPVGRVNQRQETVTSGRISCCKHSHPRVNTSNNYKALTRGCTDHCSRPQIFTWLLLI